MENCRIRSYHIFIVLTPDRASERGWGALNDISYSRTQAGTRCQQTWKDHPEKVFFDFDKVFKTIYQNMKYPVDVKNNNL